LITFLRGAYLEKRKGLMAIGLNIVAHKNSIKTKLQA
jgi:hypothetical protein